MCIFDVPVDLNNSPNWAEVVNAIGTIIIGFAAFCIGVMQWLLEKARLRQELFDHRMKLYEIISIIKPNYKGYVDLSDTNLHLLWAQIPVCEVYFNRDVADRLENFIKLYDRGSELSDDLRISEDDLEAKLISEDIALNIKSLPAKAEKILKIMMIIVRRG